MQRDLTLFANRGVLAQFMVRVDNQKRASRLALHGADRPISISKNDSADLFQGKPIRVGSHSGCIDGIGLNVLSEVYYQKLFFDTMMGICAKK